MPSLFLGEGFKAILYQIPRLVGVPESDMHSCQTVQDHSRQAAGVWYTEPMSIFTLDC